MKRLIQISLLFLFVSCAFAQETLAPKEKVLRVYDWTHLNVQSPNTNCQIKIISMDGMSVLKIENTNDAPLFVSLLKIDDSALIGRADFISCEMAIENVHEKNYISTNSDGSIGIGGMFGGRLDLSQVFPPVAAGGDQTTNNPWYNFNGGTKNWNQYNLDLKRTSYSYANTPTYLELKLYLLASGTVYLRPIKFFGVASSWWSP